MAGLKFLLLVMAIPLVLAGCAGATGDVKASLDEEFSLAIGQTAVIRGENLEIKFKEVLEDSRCPEGAVCVWEGRVRCLIKLVDDKSSENLELTQPGLSDQYSSATHNNYQLSFKFYTKFFTYLLEFLHKSCCFFF